MLCLDSLSYARGDPLASPISQGGFLLHCLQNKELLWGFFSADIPHGIKPWPLPGWFTWLGDEWQEPPPGGLFLAMAANSPSRFPSCAPFAQQPTHGQTSFGRGTGGEICLVPTWEDHLKINLHLISSLPCRMRCPFLLPISLLWQFPHPMIVF